MKPIQLSIALLGLLSTTVACSSDAAPEAADAGFNCELDGRGEAFTAGMSKTGAAGYEFILVDAVPSPPGKGDNAWTVRLNDPDSVAVEGPPTVRLIMPDHGHGTPIIPVVTAVEDGAFSVTPLNLWMPGLWEITLEIRSDDAVLDESTFRFCIDG